MELYWYKADYLRNYDGDTVDLLLDLGFHLHWQMRVRLYGINAPELKSPTLDAGRASQVFLEDILREAKVVQLKSHKDQADKYGGRWLGEIYANVIWDPVTKVASYDPTAPLLNLNQLMVTAGHAVPYNP